MMMMAMIMMMMKSSCSRRHEASQAILSSSCRLIPDPLVFASAAWPSMVCMKSIRFRTLYNVAVYNESIRPPVSGGSFTNSNGPPDLVMDIPLETRIAWDNGPSPRWNVRRSYRSSQPTQTWTRKLFVFQTLANRLNL